MRIQLDCIPCIAKMSISIMRSLNLEEDLMKTMTHRIMALPSLRGEDWTLSSPDIIERIMEMLYEAIGDTNPFKVLKGEQTRKMLELYSALEQQVKEAQDPLYEALKMAVVGNSIDFMVNTGTSDLQATVRERLKLELDQKAYRQWRAEIEKARCLVYFGDNAGEIVLDRLFIQTIRERFEKDVFFVCRSMATLNDATIEDARMAGLDQVASLLANGIQGPLPGTTLERCSQEIRDLVDRADLLIAKGGGNFDSLEEQRALIRAPLTYLLVSKCHPYYERFGVEPFRPVIYVANPNVGYQANLHL